MVQNWGSKTSSRIITTRTHLYSISRLASSSNPKGDPVPSEAPQADQNDSQSWLKRIFTRQLPLQDETTFFILVNVLDYFMTNILIRTGAIEANPVAAYALSRWGFPGMVAFKMGIVAAICILAQIVALKSMSRARFILVAGIVITGGVVIYSGFLLYGQLN